MYDQAKIYGITITNRTDLDVELTNVTVENSNYLNPTVNGKSTAVTPSRSLLSHVSVVSTALTIYRPENATLVTMPIPGQLEYVAGVTEELGSDLTLGMGDLEKYLVGFDSQTNAYRYELPNGTVIFLDRVGYLVRVIDGGLDIDFSNYVKYGTGTAVEILNSLILDCSDGTMTIREDTTFDTLLKNLDGAWLEDLIKSTTDGATSSVKAVLKHPTETTTSYDYDENDNLVEVTVPDFAAHWGDWDSMPSDTLTPSSDSATAGYKFSKTFFVSKDGILYFYTDDFSAADKTGFQAWYDPSTGTFGSPSIQVRPSYDNTTIDTTAEGFPVFPIVEEELEGGMVYKTLVNYLTVTNYYDNSDDELVYITCRMPANLISGSDYDLIADSEGNLFFADGTDASWTVVEDAGSAYAVSGIAGKDTTVTIADTGEGAKLLNGTAPAITGDTIAIVIAEGTDIGTKDDPLSTASYTEGEKAEVTFETLATGEENVIAGEVWIETVGSAKLPEDLTITEGASYHHEASLDIIYTAIGVAKNGTVGLVAARDVICVSKADGTEGHLTVAEGATASLTAGRDNSFQNVIAAGATGTTPAASTRIASTGTYVDPDGVTCTGSITGGKLTGGMDATVTLSAVGDINAADDYLVVDPPEGTPLVIEHAADYYVMAAGTATVTGRTEDGGDESGAYVSGLGTETVSQALVSGDTAELAAWMLARIGSNDAVVAQLDFVGTEPVDDIVAAGDAEAFAAWLDAQIAQGTVNESLLASFISQLLIADDLATLEEAAWADPTYPATGPNAAEDLRGLTIMVGESTGSAYVTNVGDVQVTQYAGTMTVGSVASPYGDVTLRVTGNLVGATTDDANVQANDVTIVANVSAGGDVSITSTGAVSGKAAGENVTIVADGDIGSEAEPFDALDADSVSATSVYGNAYDVTAGHVFTAVWEQIVNPTPGPIPDPTPGPTPVRPDNGGNLVPQAGDATSAGSMATMALSAWR